MRVGDYDVSIDTEAVTWAVMVKAVVAFVVAISYIVGKVVIRATPGGPPDQSSPLPFYAEYVTATIGFVTIAVAFVAICMVILAVDYVLHIEPADGADR